MLFLHRLHFQLSIPCIGQKKYSYLIVLVLEYMFQVAGYEWQVPGYRMNGLWVKNSKLLVKRLGLTRWDNVLMFDLGMKGRNVK